MSSMTMPLWRVLELTEDPGNGAMIGLDSYPIFDEQERDGINQLIINHFWNRDIGQETIDMFTFMMRRTMREIMPTYNQLYLSQRISFNPLATYDLTTVRDGTSSETGTQNSSSTTAGDSSGESKSAFFDTPQVALSGSKDYATNVTAAESDSKNTGTSTGDTTSKADASNTDTSRTTGFQGSAADLLTRFRATIINTDLMLLNDPELTTMFLGVWDSGDQIAPPRRFHALERY